MKIICQKVNQNSMEFYIGKIKFQDLAVISTTNHRIIMGFDENDEPIYNNANNFQRKINSTRKNSIKDYLLMDEQATFPNSIILSVPSSLLKNEISDSEITEIDIDESKIQLDATNPLYVQIIDGQHRFSGMKAACEELELNGDLDRCNILKNFEFVVSIYVNVGIEFQAMLFSTINRTQVRVPNDIVFDLFGVVEKDCPQKTALAICLELNSSRKISDNQISPFSRRIKLLGKKRMGENSVISQQIFIKTIILLICPTLNISEVERFKDREAFRRGGSYRTIFREFYAKGRDNNMFMTLVNFFVAVEETFLDPEGNSYWKIGNSKDNAFQRTIGFLALIDVLIELFYRGMVERRLDVEFFKENLKKAQNIKLLNATGESNDPYTSKGKGQLSKDLLDLIA